MSLHQVIISSAVGAVVANPYPVPGYGYPAAGGSINATGYIETNIAYFEPSSISNPVVGLWRRTYQGNALPGNGTIDPAFPDSYTQAQSKLDAYVGFGNGSDVANNYSMEWKGYFKPTVTGDFVFSASIDDYMFLWIGGAAIGGYDNTNRVLQDSMGSGRYHMEAGKYYPVRMIFTEMFGGNECNISFALNGETLANNQENAASGQFYTDDSTNTGVYPSGLVQPV